MTHTHINNSKRGVTIFFALLIISLMLGIGTSISLLAEKQVTLSTLNKQSELAFYAADSAAECAQYWDMKYNAFDPAQDSAIVITCDHIDNADSLPVCSSSCASLVHSFDINFGQACAHVTITKTDLGNSLYGTSIESDGFSTCSNTDKRLERAVYLTY